MFCGCETSRIMKMRDVFTSVMRSLIFFSATLSGLRQAAFSRVFGAGGWVKKRTPHNAVLSVIRGSSFIQLVSDGMASSAFAFCSLMIWMYVL